MRRGIVCGALMAALLAACDDGLEGLEFPAVAGRYAVRFEATEVTACQGFVEPGFTDGFLDVEQKDEEVTLKLTGVTEFIRDDPKGTIDIDGRFFFDGTIAITDGQTSTTAGGMIDGFFNVVAGTIDLAFDFSAFTCRVRGEITGQRSLQP